jgi:threonine dehydratase
VCGTALVAKALRPETKVIGVQSTGAPAVAESWRQGAIHPNDRVTTWAEGLATRVPATMTFEIMRELMDDVILVDDEDLYCAVKTLLTQTHNLAEGAGAAALAAAYQERERFTGRTVVGVLSGGNLDIEALPRVLGVEEFGEGGS